MKKDNDFYQSIYSLMKKKLDYRMDEGVEQDLRKIPESRPGPTTPERIQSIIKFLF